MKLNKQAQLVFDFFHKKVVKLQEEKDVLETELLDKSFELEMLKATYQGFTKGLKKKVKRKGK